MDNAPNPYPLLNHHQINLKYYDLVLQVNSIKQLLEGGWPIRFSEDGKKNMKSLKK